MIKQLNLQDPAGLKNSPGEPHIGFGRGRIPGGMIVHHDEGVGGMNNRGLKHLARMGQRFIDAALADRADLD